MAADDHEKGCEPNILGSKLCHSVGVFHVTTLLSLVPNWCQIVIFPSNNASVRVLVIPRYVDIDLSFVSPYTISHESESPTHAALPLSSQEWAILSTQADCPVRLSVANMACVYSPRAWPGHGRLGAANGGRTGGRTGDGPHTMCSSCFPFPARSMTADSSAETDRAGLRPSVAGALVGRSVGHSLALRLPRPFPDGEHAWAGQAGQDRAGQVRTRGEARRGEEGRKEGGTEEGQRQTRRSRHDAWRVSSSLQRLKTAEAEDTEVRVYLAGCGLTRRRAATTTIGGGSCRSTHGRPTRAARVSSLRHLTRQELTGGDRLSQDSTRTPPPPPDAQADAPVASPRPDSRSRRGGRATGTDGHCKKRVKGADGRLPCVPRR